MIFILPSSASYSVSPSTHRHRLRAHYYRKLESYPIRWSFKISLLEIPGMRSTSAFRSDRDFAGPRQVSGLTSDRGRGYRIACDTSTTLRLFVCSSHRPDHVLVSRHPIPSIRDRLSPIGGPTFSLAMIYNTSLDPTQQISVISTACRVGREQRNERKDMPSGRSKSKGLCER
jgi:hypothetical protein